MAKKILLIDDDPDFLMMNEAVLKNMGYEVLTASSAKEGLEKSQNESPDLIILDLMMEHYDSGFSLSYNIKNSPKTKDVPVIMCSGVHRETGMKFDSKTGEEKDWIKVDEFLEKPISPDDLSSIIKKYL